LGFSSFARIFLCAHSPSALQEKADKNLFNNFVRRNDEEQEKSTPWTF
jgi:hypothetical protein